MDRRTKQSRVASDLKITTAIRVYTCDFFFPKEKEKTSNQNLIKVNVANGNISAGVIYFSAKKIYAVTAKRRGEVTNRGVFGVLS